MNIDLVFISEDSVRNDYPILDDHDVKQFLTHSLYPPGTMGPAAAGEPAKPEDQVKLTAEYAEYQRKLELQKEQ